MPKGRESGGGHLRYTASQDGNLKMNCNSSRTVCSFCGYIPGVLPRRRARKFVYLRVILPRIEKSPYSVTVQLRQRRHTVIGVGNIILALEFEQYAQLPPMTIYMLRCGMLSKASK